MTDSWSDIEAEMRRGAVRAVNIQCSEKGFRVHVRRHDGNGFLCAQRDHGSISSALSEHFGSRHDLSDLL